MSEFFFNPPYSISGEDGKSYGAAKRELGMIGVQAATLEFVSQGEDVLSWSQTAGTPPEYGQIITLFDKDGTRVFTGNVTSVVPLWTGSGVASYDVIVSGPWWWLEQAQLTGLVADSTGEQKERVAFVLATQDITISVTSIITRMRELGVPLTVGEIDTTFTVPQMILQGTSAAVALRDVLGLLPDATTSVDYSGDGLPRLNIHRRPTMDTKTFVIGTNDPVLRAPISLRARHELRPVSVEVQSIRVDSAGEIFYETQTAGDVSGVSGVLGRQLIAVSGPGRADFRENGIRKAIVKTTAKANIQEVFYAKHQGMSELKRVLGGTEAYALMTGSFTITISTGEGYVVTSYPPKTAYNIDGVATLVATDILAQFVLTEDLPDWWAETGTARQRIKISARFQCGVSTGDPNYPDVAAISTFSHEVTGGTYFFADLDVELDAIPTAYSAATLVIPPIDQALVQPVEDLAKNLFLAQDWLPFDGSLALNPSTSIPLPSHSINIRGAMPDWDYMRALQASTRINLQTGSATLRLGAPARQPASQLIDRFQRSTRSTVIRL